jgi:hypothetical protein
LAERRFVDARLAPTGRALADWSSAGRASDYDHHRCA